MDFLLEGAQKMLGELRVASEELSKITGEPSPEAREVKSLAHSILRPRVRLRDTVEEVEWAKDNPEIQEILDMINDAVDKM
jgi:hypothetical protein